MIRWKYFEKYGKIGESFFAPFPPPCLFPPRITLQKLILCQTPLLLSLALVSLSKINYRLWKIPEDISFCFADCPEIIQISIWELHSDSDFYPRNAVMTIHNYLLKHIQELQFFLRFVFYFYESIIYRAFCLFLSKNVNLLLILIEFSRTLTRPD